MRGHQARMTIAFAPEQPAAQAAPISLAILTPDWKTCIALWCRSWGLFEECKLR